MKIIVDSFPYVLTLLIIFLLIMIVKTYIEIFNLKKKTNLKNPIPSQNPNIDYFKAYLINKSSLGTNIESKLKKLQAIEYQRELAELTNESKTQLPFKLYDHFEDVKGEEFDLSKETELDEFFLNASQNIR